MRLGIFCICTIITLYGTAFSQKVVSLQESLNIAMDNSPQIQEARLSLKRSQETLNAQKAALKSQFSLSVTPFSYSSDRVFNQFYNTWNTNESKSSSASFRVSQPIKWTDGTFNIINNLRWQDSWSEFRNEQFTSFSNNLYLNYEQPLFTYNRTMLETKELELDLENSALNYIIRRLAVEYNVTNQFYNVYSNKLNVQIAKEEYANQKTSYQIIKNKVDAGLSAKEELYQAELNLATSESNLQNRKVALANSKDQFKKLIGLSIEDSLDIVGDVTHTHVKVDAHKAMQHALEQRMELRQATIDIETAYNDLIQTKTINEFRGDLSLTYGIIGDDQDLVNVYDTPTKNQKASISFEIPLYDWGERESRIQASQAVMQSQRLSLREQRKDIKIEIRELLRSLDNLTNQISIARQNVRNAELTYEINLERYKNGDLTSMDLNLYQNQLSEKKIALVQAIIDYKLALLDLKISSLYDFIRDEPVSPQEITDVNLSGLW